MIMNPRATSFIVIAGLDPAIYAAVPRWNAAWMPGSSPGMTD
jgi:hypothetical protein